MNTHAHTHTHTHAYTHTHTRACTLEYLMCVSLTQLYVHTQAHNTRARTLDVFSLFVVVESGWKPSEEDKRFVVHVMCYMGCWGTSEGNFPNFLP